MKKKRASRRGAKTQRKKINHEPHKPHEQTQIIPKEEIPYKIPKDWKWVRLGDVTTIYAGGTPSSNNSEYYNGGKIPWITPADLSNYKSMYISAGKKNITSLGLKKSSACLLPKNTVLLSTRAPIGYVAIAQNELCTNQGFKNFVTSSLLLPEYLYLFLKDNKENLESHASGTTFLELSKSKAAIFPIPLPPLDEQNRIIKRIGSLFAKLDKAKEIAKNALDSFENRKATVLHKAFSGELTAKWRKEHGVGMDSWKERRLYETDIEIIDGDRGVNYPKKEDFTQTNGYCLFLNAKNVTKNGFAFDEIQFVSKEKDNQLRKGKLERDDIVLTTRGTVGNIALYNKTIPFKNMRINSGMVIFRGGNDFYKSYFYWLFKSRIVLDQISSIKTGSAQPQLPIKIMKNLLLPLPTQAEQKEIVRILDSLFKKEKCARDFADVVGKIDVMKKAILARAFRGELG